MDGVASSEYFHQGLPDFDFTVSQMLDRSPQHNWGDNACAAAMVNESFQYFAIQLQRELPVDGISVLKRGDCDICG